MWDYSDTYRVVNGTMTGTAANAVVLKNCSLFNGCLTGINKSWADEASEPDLIMLIYNLIK